MAVGRPKREKKMALWKSVVAQLCLFASVATAHSLADDSLVTNLPGAEGMGFPNMYSGYLDLPGTEKHVFYWYVESNNNPAEAPVALWTNGGPGKCSILALPFHFLI
jgi:carboxypeptidase C (cathepsin A)